MENNSIFILIIIPTASKIRTISITNIIQGYRKPEVVDNGTLVLSYLGSELWVGDEATRMGRYQPYRKIKIFRVERNWKGDDPSAYVSISYYCTGYASFSILFLRSQMYAKMFIKNHHTYNS